VCPYDLSFASRTHIALVRASGSGCQIYPFALENEKDHDLPWLFCRLFLIIRDGVTKLLFWIHARMCHRNVFLAIGIVYAKGLSSFSIRITRTTGALETESDPGSSLLLSSLHLHIVPWFTKLYIRICCFGAVFKVALTQLQFHSSMKRETVLVL